MTEEEARQIAIRAGALRPQGFAEGAAANWMQAQGHQSWANCARAQSRLAEWTRLVMEGKSLPTTQSTGCLLVLVGLAVALTVGVWVARASGLV